jgi:hypothetical protein
MQIGCSHLLYPASVPNALMYVEDSDLNGFDPWPITKGIPVPQDCFAGAKLYLKGRVEPSVLGNPHSLLLLSESLYSEISELCGEECQWLKIACVVLHSSRILQYYAMNSHRILDAAIPDSKGRSTLYNLKLDKRCVPSGCHHFRLQTSLNLQLFSDLVAAKLDRLGLVGTCIDSFPLVDR